MDGKKRNMDGSRIGHPCESSFPRFYHTGTSIFKEISDLHLYLYRSPCPPKNIFWPTRVTEAGGTLGAVDLCPELRPAKIVAQVWRSMTFTDVLLLCLACCARTSGIVHRASGTFSDATSTARGRTRAVLPGFAALEGDKGGF